MKRIIGLILSALLILLMASVGFASDIKFEEGSVISIEGPFDYDAEEHIMRDPSHLAYGRTAYYILYNTNGGAYEPISNRDYVEKLKIKTEYEMGKELVHSVTITKKRIEVGESASPKLTNLNAEDGYYYVVGFDINDKETVFDADIIGTITFNRKKIDINDNNITDAFEGKIDDEKFDFNINVFYGGYDYLADTTNLVVDNDVTLDYDQAYALKFDSDDEVEFTFGRDVVNEGSFTIDVSGQPKLYFKWDTQPNDIIVKANPDADMFFVNFHDVKFNRVGEFVYEMEDIKAVYKIVNDELVEIKNAKFDGDEVSFTTRILENYVFSTSKLSTSTSAAVEEVVVPSTPIVINPNTGVEL